MRIPYVNLPAQHAAIREELLEAVRGVLDHGRFILGPEVEEFEARFAELCGTRHCVTVNSGTDALVLALRAIGVGSGDEVVTVPSSFVASVGAIAAVGARPVLVDVGPDHNMDTERLEEALTGRTKAILPVHLEGRPASMDRICEIARLRGVPVVADAAQAIGAELHGRPVGVLAEISCFSLHPLKTLNACGDGGALVFDDDGLVDRLRALRNIGLRTRAVCLEWGVNSRLDTIQAAMLLVKLRYLPRWLEGRRRNADAYRARLAGLAGLRLPAEHPGARHAYHVFVVEADQRDALQVYLRERGIGTAIHYPVPIHLQPAARSLGYGPGRFPEAERQAQAILSLPIYPELSPEDLDEVAACVREFYEEH